MDTIPAYRLFSVTLVRKRWLSPSLVSCLFTGEEVGMMKRDGPDQRIKILFPSLQGVPASLTAHLPWREQLKPCRQSKDRYRAPTRCARLMLPTASQRLSLLFMAQRGPLRPGSSAPRQATLCRWLRPTGNTPTTAADMNGGLIPG